MNVASFLRGAQKLEANFIAFIKKEEPKVVTDMQAAVQLGDKAIAWAKSPAGITVQAFIAAEIPGAGAIEAAALAILTELLNDISKVTSIPALEAVASRIAAEVLNIWNGEKMPIGVSGWLTKIDEAFAA
jgi:hypothetical protein